MSEMACRILIEATDDKGFSGTEFARRGWFIAVVKDDGYDGGGFSRHNGHWMVLSDQSSGEIFKAPLYRCKEVSS